MLLEEIDVFLRRVAIGKLSYSAMVGNSEISLANYVHSNQDTSTARQLALCDMHAAKRHVVGQVNVYEVNLRKFFAMNTMDLHHGYRLQPTRIDYILGDY